MHISNALSVFTFTSFGCKPSVHIAGQRLPPHKHFGGASALFHYPSGSCGFYGQSVVFGFFHWFGGGLFIHQILINPTVREQGSGREESNLLSPSRVSWRFQRLISFAYSRQVCIVPLSTQKLDRLPRPDPCSHCLSRQPALERQQKGRP